MSYSQQNIGCSGFSPARTSFQQTGGESERLSMEYASPHGHLPYSVNSLGQSTFRVCPQQGYRPYTVNGQPRSFSDYQLSSQRDVQRGATWGQAPIQQGVNSPTHFFSTDVKAEPGWNQQMQHPPQDKQEPLMVPQELRVPRYPAFGDCLQNQDYQLKGQTEWQKRSAQPYMSALSPQNKPYGLPKYLYYSQSSSWAEFYRKFSNYARDKHWSSAECKTNMGYVLEGRAAEYFNIINQQKPDLPYYDLLNQMQDFMEGLESSKVLFPVRASYSIQNLGDWQTKQQGPGSMYQYSPPTNMVQGPQLNSSFIVPHCLGQNNSIQCRDNQHANSSVVHIQSIDTDFVSSQCNTLNCDPILTNTLSTRESQSCYQQRERYISYKGSHSNSSSDTDTCNQLENENVVKRLIHLEKMFGHVMERADSYLSLQLEPEPQVQTSSLHQPLSSSLHKPHPSLHDPQASSVHDPQPSCSLNSQTSTLHSPPPSQTKKPCQNRTEQYSKLEPSSETTDVTISSGTANHCSPQESREIAEEKESFRTVKDYEDWLDGVFDNQFGTSTPKVEPSGALQEYEDWLDQTYEETTVREYGSILLLYSEKDPQEVSGDTVDVSNSHQDVQESHSSGTEFWWDSLEMKELRAGDDTDSLNSCDEYIDCMYSRLFGTSTLKVEASSTRECEKWLDRMFEVTVGPTSPHTLSNRVESIQEEDSVKQEGAAMERYNPITVISPARQEPTDTTGSFAPAFTQDFLRVNPYSAWDPSIDPKEESSTDSNLGNVYSCQLPSSFVLRVPVTLQRKSLKAVIDTAAMVPIVSDRIYREMKPTPPYLKVVTLQLAGRDMKMDGHIVGPVTLRLGNTEFLEMVHVAPIDDDMLLGLDFLLKHGVNFKLKELYLEFKAAKEKVTFEIVKSERNGNTISKVTAERVELIPAFPNALVKSSHSQKRANSTLVPEEFRRIDTFHTWFPYGLETLISPDRMMCHLPLAEVIPPCWVPPALSHNLGGIPEVAKVHLDGPESSNRRDSGDPVGKEKLVLAIRVEGGSPIQHTGAIAPQALFGLNTYSLRTDANRVPEPVVSDLNMAKCDGFAGLTLDNMGTQGYYQSKCCILFQMSVRRYSEDEQQWPWDPGGK